MGGNHSKGASKYAVRCCYAVQFGLGFAFAAVRLVGDYTPEHVLVSVVSARDPLDATQFDKSKS